MKLKSFFALLKNPKLAEEGRIHIKIDYEKEGDLEQLEKLEKATGLAVDIKESA